MSRKKRKRNRSEKVVKLESLKQIKPNAAGLDIGASEIWVCVPEGRDEVSVKVFGTYTPDLKLLAEWLKECGVETVAMESTGVYWIPIYEILEEREFEVCLINARHVKNVPGKKTDVIDCQWIQQLHTYGLLSASFRPKKEMVALRSYIRHRDNLIRYRVAHIQHMQKALHLMNIQLHQVLSETTGETSLKIIRAIVDGERDPIRLAQYRHPRCHSTQDEIAKALSGNYQAEHIFALKQALELYDFYSQQIQACDLEIERKYTSLKPVFDIDPTSPPPPISEKKRHSKNEPAFDLHSHLYRLTGVDLTAINGLDVLTVQQIISETGTDMSPWPTVKHFASWLSLSPNNKKSGGKLISSRTLKSSNRAADAFRMAAQSAGRSQSALGAFYRRIRAKHGPPKAITATAHKIARIFYHLLKYKKPFIDPGQDAYEQKFKQRIISNLKRRAKSLGMELIPIQTTSDA